MEMNTPNSNTLCVCIFMCIVTTAFGLITMHNGGISLDRTFNEMKNVDNKEGLKIKQTDSGRYYIALNDEVIHGGIYGKGEAESHMQTYQKIYDAGVRKGISQK